MTVKELITKLLEMPIDAKVELDVSYTQADGVEIGIMKFAHNVTCDNRIKGEYVVIASE